ncbi:MULTISPECIES: GntR family transcriptional regulator [unclassified Arthrobacter]|uniref:GntR family transcriptional regulator n=1 Tax=unclassified Arthrobacter TaxID=235627 RepID=UPI00159D781F|nr:MULTISPECIES: GntR family transcriptional regulator [unclassified Arthrobacter]MCQ9164435.1 GntR family transcriptional regulator [Arthrobacter sp. STN4]NVM97979.1 GntR family transcriptional regulator [Arthrobacter sp. SDTb3-6]
MGYPVPPAASVPGHLERDSGVSVHIQLRELFRAYVTGLAKAGSQLPSERDLAEHFGVARMTVRHAIEALVDEELLDRVVGVGTFVSHEKLDVQVKLTSYSEEMQRRGMRPAARTLSFEQIPATARLARELQMEEGQPVIRFRRLLLADEEPMSVDENFIPAWRVPGILEQGPPTSLYNLLSERYGLVIEWGEDIVEANAATPSIARLLKVDVGAPVLRMERHAFVSQSSVDYSISFYRADRYKLRVPLQRPGVRIRRGY